MNDVKEEEWYLLVKKIKKQCNEKRRAVEIRQWELKEIELERIATSQGRFWF